MGTELCSSVESWDQSSVLSRKPDPTNPSADCFQYHARGRKGLVTLGRFPCAASRFVHRQSDWLQLHNSELILMCETAKLKERGGYGCYPR